MSEKEICFDLIVAPNMIDYNMEINGVKMFFIWPVIEPIFDSISGDPTGEINLRHLLNNGKLPSFEYSLHVPTIDKDFLTETKDYLFREYTTGKSLQYLKFEYPKKDVSKGYITTVRGRRPDGKLFIQGEEVQNYLNLRKRYKEAEIAYKKGLIGKDTLGSVKQLYEDAKKNFEKMMRCFYGDLESYDEIIEILESDRKEFDNWFSKHVIITVNPLLQKLWVSFAIEWFKLKDSMNISNFYQLDSRENGYDTRYTFVLEMYKKLKEIVSKLIEEYKENTRVEQELNLIYENCRNIVDEEWLVSDPEKTTMGVPVFFPKQSAGLQLLDRILFNAFNFFLSL